jgi:hypothetical protein
MRVLLRFVTSRFALLAHAHAVSVERRLEL